MDSGLVSLLQQYGVDPPSSTQAPATSTLAEYLHDVPGNNAIGSESSTLLQPLLSDIGQRREIEPISAEAFAKNLTLRAGKSEDRYGFLSAPSDDAAASNILQTSSADAAQASSKALKMTIKMGPDPKQPKLQGSLKMKLSTRK
eukprot:TRINITY_DN4385_c0_g1_i1.p1 TRINITY_DN4385_c0_g1~~TRINITY_DN4385_c0_g1_i1.p1  ORF type:complete len:144 (+),score=28.38 TRINITY_DN4385_c0_g1_i1:112-543(+)